jgi:geranyl diphosphate synthase
MVGLPDSLKETVKSSLLEHATTREISSQYSDPLDDLDFSSSTTTRYWPNLPPQVEYQDPVALSATEMSRLVDSIRNDMLGTENPILHTAASYFFKGDSGKKVRPMLVLLLARALADSMEASTPSNDQLLLSEPFQWQRPDLPSVQRRLACVAELFHTASLLHDDVLDESSTRRNRPTVHTVLGNKMAILAGDFLLARASLTLSRMSNHAVVECMSTVLEHLVLGEVLQSKGLNDKLQTPVMVQYLRKNFYKTASLMALSCQSLALLGDYPQDMVLVSYRFGKHLGMAFQLVDDVLDFEASEELLGKPTFSDVRAGLATAPVLFAAEEFPELDALIDRKFNQDGDVEKAVELVFQSDGIERTKELARLHAEHAMDVILELNPSACRDALVTLAYKVVARTR